MNTNTLVLATTAVFLMTGMQSNAMTAQNELNLITPQTYAIGQRHAETVLPVQLFYKIDKSIKFQSMRKYKSLPIEIWYALISALDLQDFDDSGTNSMIEEAFKNPVEGVDSIPQEGYKYMKACVNALHTNPFLKGLLSLHDHEINNVIAKNLIYFNGTSHPYHSPQELQEAGIHDIAKKVEDIVKTRAAQEGQEGMYRPILQKIETILYGNLK